MSIDPREHDELAELIGRELKNLPLLKAPETLLPRVMARIEAAAAAPMPSRSWQSWPVPLRVLMWVTLLLCFAGASLAFWKVPQLEYFVQMNESIQTGLTVMGALSTAVTTMATALGRVINNLNPAIVRGCLAALVLGYAMCLGLGAVYFKLALVRRND